jgi:hypothetical protein
MITALFQIPPERETDSLERLIGSWMRLVIEYIRHEAKRELSKLTNLVSPQHGDSLNSLWLLASGFWLLCCITRRHWLHLFNRITCNTSRYNPYTIVL